MFRWLGLGFWYSKVVILHGESWNEPILLESDIAGGFEGVLFSTPNVGETMQFD